jgi:hypothetical protein
MNGLIVQYLEIPNWRKYQHYGKRRPPWVKMYRDLLRDREFSELPDACRWHWVGLALLAAYHENRIPYDVTYIRREINAKSNIDFTRLFASGMLAICKQDARASTETETETETETYGGSNGLLRAWETDIMGEAGLPSGAIPPMSNGDRNRPDGAGWKELDGIIDWAVGEYGGYDAVRARLVDLAKQHKAGKLKLFSLKATLNSPDLMRPKPKMETMEEYRARLANLPD